jgi:hypothetical protein
MSRTAEIFQRYQTEIAEASRRGREMHDEVLRQERDVLITNVPAAKKAIEAFDVAVADAFRTFREALEELELDLAENEAKAIDQQFPDEQLAETNWQKARASAASKLEKALRRADAEFEDEDREGRTMIGQRKDAALSQARNKRDAAYAEANRIFLAEDDEAYGDYRVADQAAREKAIAKIDELRLDHKRAGENHERTLERAKQQAAERLEAALSGDPIAAAIREAFQMRLETVGRESELEKQAIYARMKAELAGAPPS